MSIQLQPARRYRRALRVVLSRQQNAYGFTLVVWGTGALTLDELGKPNALAVFAFILGALAGVSLAIALTFGLTEPFTQKEPERRPFSAIHLLSVPAALGAGWGMSILVHGAPGYFLAALAAAAVHEALLGFELALGLPE